jgi:hypothetical protein
MATSGSPESIGAAKDRSRRRDRTDQGYWCAPPDSSRQKKNRVSAGIHLAVDCYDAHRGQQVWLRYSEAFAHPGTLQGSEVEAAAGEGPFEQSREATTGRAGAVIEHPAAKPRFITNFCNF